MVTGKVDTSLVSSTSFVLIADADDIPVIINANDTTIAISFFSNLRKLDSPPGVLIFQLCFNIY